MTGMGRKAVIPFQTLPLLALLPRRIFRVAGGLQFGFGRCRHRVGFSFRLGGGVCLGAGAASPRVSSGVLACVSRSVLLRLPFVSVCMYLTGAVVERSRAHQAHPIRTSLARGCWQRPAFPRGQTEAGVLVQ